MAMNGLLKQAATNIRKFTIGALLAIGLVNVSALANESEIDNVIILPTSLSEISEGSISSKEALHLPSGRR